MGLGVEVGFERNNKNQLKINLSTSKANMVYYNCKEKNKKQKEYLKS